MFNNIGRKIKSVAVVITWIGIISSIIFGLSLMISDDEPILILIGLLVMVIGSISSWLGSLIFYGFGQLVENSDELVKMQNGTIEEPTQKNNQTTKGTNVPTNDSPIIRECDIKVGLKVNHETYGTGTITEVSGDIVVVTFLNGSETRFFKSVICNEFTK